MPTEFVVRLMKETYPKRQELPDAFDEFCYNGNKHVYLTSQERVRLKVQIVKPSGGPTELRGERWKQFCLAYIPMDAYLLHFVQEGDDSFYVTSYDDSGYETGGYEGIIGRPCRFMSWVFPYHNIPQRIASDLLPGLQINDTIKISAHGRRFTVKVRRAKDPRNTGRNVYVMMGETWNTIVNRFKLKAGQYVVFMRKSSNYLRLQAFNMHGSPVTQVYFLGATPLLRNQPELDFWEKSDDRIHHKCTWERHMAHFGEKHETFYTPYKEIVERQRLTIPADFLDDHPMHTYTKCYIRHQQIENRMTVKMVPHSENPTQTNHVIMTGEWRKFADECFIKYDQMLRFKYMFNVEVLDGDDAGVFHVFHVC